jgi:peptidoglycan/LPS O-acetylase OafA/YrhL
MRGLAAFTVVLYHLDGFAQAVPGGHLAVNFFFALSGLVIARTYDSRLAEGLSPGRFVLMRAIRLYPLFMFGVGLALIKDIGQAAFHDPQALSPGELAISLATEMLMLPSPATGVDLFPLNGPAWSLFFEMVAYTAYGVLALRIGRRTLVCIALASAALMAFATVQAGDMNVGWGWATFHGGLGRTGFSFALGVLIHRLGWSTTTRSSYWALAPVLLLIGLVILPVSATLRPAFDVATAALVIPALLIWGARLQLPDPLIRPATWIADASYPLYAIHFPLLFMTGFVARSLGLPLVIWGPLFLAGVVIFAYALGRCYDAPVRRWLTAKVAAARGPQPAS